MLALQTEVFVNISSEFSQFGIKLKEELNKEKEGFITKVEVDEQQALDDYGITSMESTIGTALEVILDENKDAVDELVTTFIEKIEIEAGIKEAMITKGRTMEWNSKM